MKNEIYDSMLSRYDLTTEQNKRNAIFEVNQQVILAGLYAIMYHLILFIWLKDANNSTMRK